MNSILIVKEIKGVTVASFDGVNRFNAVVSQTVKEQINHYLSESGAKVVFDLEGIRFIDSSAFGALISNLRTAKQTNSTFILCNLASEVKEIIYVMQLDTVFTICETVDESISKMS
jgi:anti-sigma B factor antagonist